LIHPTKNYNNLDIINNMALRVKQFVGLMGGHDLDAISSYNIINSLDVFTYIISISIVFLIIYCFTSKNRILNSKVKTIIIICLVMFIGLCFTVSCLRTMHLFILVPFPQIIIALFIVYSIKYMNSSGVNKIIKYAWKSLVCTAFIMLIVNNISVLSIYRSRDFTINLKENTMCVYELADYLKVQGISNLYVPANPDKNRNLWFLMKGQNAIKELAFEHNSPLIGGTKKYVLAYSSREEYSPQCQIKYDLWDKNKNNFNITKVKIFKDNAGRDIYYLYEIN
jgi:hypothetical protein